MNRIVAVLLLALGAGVALGQGAEDGDVVRMSPKEGGWHVEDLVRTFAEYTDQKILYEPDNPAIRGKRIVWQGTVEVPREKLFRWFRGVLSFQRLILVPVGPREAGLWMLVEINATQIGNHPEYVPEEELADWKDADGCYILTTITAPNVSDTSRLRNALAQNSTRPNGKVNDVPGARAFVVADFAPVVFAMREQILEVDRASKGAPPVPEPRRETKTPRKRELEISLAASQTELAAQYFLNELRLLAAEEAKSGEEREE